MATWKKLLARMMNDTNPCTYEYDDAAAVLQHLGFEVAPNSGTSHRKWRRKLNDGRIARIGLVQSAGPMKPYLVRDMIGVLRSHDLIPAYLED